MRWDSIKEAIEVTTGKYLYYSDAGFVSLEDLQLLALNTTLTHLYLNCNEIEDEGVKLWSTIAP